MAIKLLIGGSPCTHWSIAQKKDRETKPEGLGWELFVNYLIAKEKFKPDFFLYENNKSASQPIKDQIAYEFGVGVDEDVRFTYINSALVSAQNRQRFYVTNFGDIEMPQDRGILLKDILETGNGFGEAKGKTYCMTASYYKGKEPEKILTRKERTHVAEPVRIPDYGPDKARPLNAYYSNNCGGFEHRMFSENPKKQQVDMIAEPIRVGCMPSPDGTIKNSQAKRVYSVDGNSVNLVANGGKYTASGVAEPCYIGEVPEHNGVYRNGKQPSQQYRVYSTDGKSVACDQDSRKYIAEQICYAIPIEWDENGRPTKAISGADGKTYTVYEVKDGIITIKGKEYPIKLADGFYIIRKLTVTECCRLQTMPDDYCKAVSDSQAYKGLGNGWTAEVIIHLLNHALKDVPRDEEIIVLSMYDGIGTGRYCLDKMGFTNIKYYAYEIDKYPIAIAMDNYPDIIQCGDAFAVREDDWKPPQTKREWLNELLGGA